MMFKALSLVIFVFSFLGNQKAQALSYDGYTWVEVCIPGDECVVNRITQKTGDSVVLLRDGKTYPGFDAPVAYNSFKLDSASGEYIGNMSSSQYEQLKAAGLEKVEIDPENVQEEIKKTQKTIDRSFVDCLLGEAICAGGALVSLGDGGWTIGLAGLACVQAYRQCESIDIANKELFKKRDELKAKLKQAAKEKESKHGGIGGSAQEGGHGGSSAGIPTPVRETVVPVGVVTIHEGGAVSCSPDAGGHVLCRKPL
ncbi:MAG: hypothetical protein NTX25_00580 [Proteobacteria bacterium]|nr:hypothetical protein [Pseudomonadota bacterium]